VWRAYTWGRGKVTGEGGGREGEGEERERGKDVPLIDGDDHRTASAF